MVAETLAERLVSNEIESLVLTDSFPTLAGGVAGMARLDVLRDLIDTNVKRAYGVMSVQAGSSGEATVDGTPRKIAAWNTDGVELNVTVDSTTGNDITIDAGANGVYHVMAKVSFTGSAAKTFQLEIFKNGAATGFAVDRKMGSGGDVGSAMVCALVTLVATDTIEVYQSSSDGASAMTVTEAQLIIHRYGP